MELNYVNRISADDFQRLRASAGWRTIAFEQAENAVKNCFFSVSCMDGEKTVGMARLIWNMDYNVYVSDVIVEEEYRGRGIAKTMINMGLEKVREAMQEGWVVKVFLTAAKGRETFYEQFGFERMPNDHMGAALEQWFE